MIAGVRHSDRLRNSVADEGEIVEEEWAESIRVGLELDLDGEPQPIQAATAYSSAARFFGLVDPEQISPFREVDDHEAEIATEDGGTETVTINEAATLNALLAGEADSAWLGGTRYRLVTTTDFPDSAGKVTVLVAAGNKTVLVASPEGSEVHVLAYVAERSDVGKATVLLVRYAQTIS
ncbi:hypothetical protein D5S17_07710 [Pseudonocardiaceae bacterium YIM PH 21723]|nr:hypothetical protein D5S17_07710 [Pseudonocardiaceae bacterium YIM PH 21723]